MRTIHDAGALACVDGVAYGAHRAIDVKAWDVDFYLCSTYKLYGPHLALLYGKRAHFEQAAPLNHFFLDDELPLKLNPGGPNHELSAGLAGINRLPRRAPRPPRGGDEPAAPRPPRRDLRAHCRARGGAGRAAAGVSHGEARRPPYRQPRAPTGTCRAPTFSFAVDGRDAGTNRPRHKRPRDRHRRRRLLCRALHRGPGVSPRGAASSAPAWSTTNTADEVERLIRALDEAI